ncbi:MAG: ABC transporter ATP-binding protein [Candidatus Eremiobacteraeota bacterium]|nr:ABC transporter ATP-binding protein [Candidatus Eremiobacteraeota bacterium]
MLEDRLYVNQAPVAVRDVRKVYDGNVCALDGVSLEVDRGTMTALLGPSGCGKSTLLNLVACVDLPTSGTVTVDGLQTSSLSDNELTALRRDRVGTVFQFFNLLPTLSIAENVALPLVLQRVPRSKIPIAVQRVLETVGLEDRARAYPSQLSGGQLQRAAIARAIIHEPAIVLADEPTGNLDSQNGTLVLELLRELADRGQTILMATHSPEAVRACDRCVSMRDGRIRAVAS